MPEGNKNISGAGNVWFYSGSNPSNANVPAWDSSAITTDPRLSLNGSKISIGIGSPIANQNAAMITDFDIYGIPRFPLGDVGAIELVDGRPSSPVNVELNKNSF